MFNTQFREAAKEWTLEINNFYDLETSLDEVISAFEGYCSFVDDKYISVFLKNRDGTWTSCLDTEDRAAIVGAIEESRRSPSGSQITVQ